MPLTLPTVLFCKRVACPSSGMLLAYRKSRLAASECSHISRHLAACDFCSAELQLLGLYHENREDYVLPDMPVEVRVLAERLLGHSQTHFHTASEFFPA